MQNQIPKTTAATIYGDAGLIYLRAPAKIETKTNGQKKIKGNPFPKHIGITNQPKYGPNAGDYYTLKMGTEFKPGRWAILLDFDNKPDGDVKNGMTLVKKLNMDQYEAPKQLTPSKGCHYIFYVDAKQAEEMRSNSINNVTYQGEQYAVDVKFKNQLKDKPLLHIIKCKTKFPKQLLRQSTATPVSFTSEPPPRLRHKRTDKTDQSQPVSKTHRDHKSTKIWTERW